MLELLKKHPKSAELLRKYFSDKMKENIPVDFYDIMDKFPADDEMISKLIGDNFGSLFHFFDENKIYIQILVDSAFSKPNFIYKIVVGNRNVFLDRKEAEKAAVIEAFNILENEL